MNDLNALTIVPKNRDEAAELLLGGARASAIFAEARRRLTEGAKGSHTVGTLAALPAPNEEGLQNLERGLTALVEGVIHTNLRCAEAMFQVRSSRELAELQQQFMGEYIEALLNGVSMLSISARRTRTGRGQSVGC